MDSAFFGGIVSLTSAIPIIAAVMVTSANFTLNLLILGFSVNPILAAIVTIGVVGSLSASAAFVFTSSPEDKPELAKLKTFKTNTFEPFILAAKKEFPLQNHILSLAFK